MTKGLIHTLKASLLILISGATILSFAQAEEQFSEPFFVTLKESDQVVRYPGQTVWQGGPKMLYNSVTPDGKTLVVSSPKEDSVYFFDTATGKQLGRVKCEKDAKGLKISPDGKEVYVSNEGAASVSVVDVLSMKAVTSIPVKEMPHNIRFTQNGKIAYVTLQAGAGLGVIDTDKRIMVKVIPTPGIETPHNLDLSKDEKQAFIRDASNKVGVLDIKTEKMMKIIEVGNGHAGIDVTTDGIYAITGAIADDVVTIINTQTLEVIKRIKVGFGPHGVRASRDNRWTFVAVTADDKVVVIDNKSFKIAYTYDVASFPFWVAVGGNP